MDLRGREGKKEAIGTQKHFDFREQRRENKQIIIIKSTKRC